MELHGDKVQLERSERRALGIGAQDKSIPTTRLLQYWEDARARNRHNIDVAQQNPPLSPAMRCIVALGACTTAGMYAAIYEPRPSVRELERHAAILQQMMPNVLGIANDTLIPSLPE